jgi:hypothetical protein
MMPLKRSPVDHEERMRAVRNVARWKLGDSRLVVVAECRWWCWADWFWNAYCNPDEAMENLRREEAQYE